MSINGSVTLAISELDDLRDQIKNGQLKEQELNLVIKDLNDKQKKVQINLKFDERYTEMVPGTRNVRVDSREQEIAIINSSTMDTMGRSTDYGYGLHHYDPFGRYDYPKFVQVMTYNEVVKNRLHEKIEYINFDDVHVDLQLKAEQAVADKITTLKNENSKLRINVSEVESSAFEQRQAMSLANVKATDAILDAHKKEKEELISKSESKIKELEDTIKTLKNEEVEKTKDALIKDLQAKVAELSNKKSWLGHIFNP